MQTSPRHAESLLAVLKQLPAVQFAFAYGSGVLHQPGLYTGHAPPGSKHAGPPPQLTTPMTDFFLAVDDPLKWHAQNIRSNPEHYSWVAKLGPGAITGVADHVGVGVHFNTLVRMQGGQMVKYGVISTKSVLDDLRTWRHLYVAGRLQKPVLMLVSKVEELEGAQAANLQAAAAAALLLLPTHFTTSEFLTKIVGLSYSGDVRMGVAEDPQKMQRSGLNCLLKRARVRPMEGGSTSPTCKHSMPSVVCCSHSAWPAAALSHSAPRSFLQVARILQGSRAALEALYLPLLCQQLAARHAELGPGGQPGTSSPGRACGNDARDSPSGVLHPGVRSSPLSEGGGVCSLQRVARIREVGPGGRPQGVSDAGDACWERDAGAEVQGALFKQLPPALLTRVAYKLGFQVPESHLVPYQTGVRTHDTLDDVATAALRSGRMQQLVVQSITDTVRASSSSQALSGLLAAGGGKAVEYMGAKVAKALRGAIEGARTAVLAAKRLD